MSVTLSGVDLWAARASTAVLAAALAALAGVDADRVVVTLIAEAAARRRLEASITVAYEILVPTVESAAAVAALEAATPEAFDATLRVAAEEADTHAFDAAAATNLDAPAVSAYEAPGGGGGDDEGGGDALGVGAIVAAVAAVALVVVGAAAAAVFFRAGGSPEARCKMSKENTTVEMTENPAYTPQSSVVSNIGDASEQRSSVV